MDKTVLSIDDLAVESFTPMSVNQERTADMETGCVSGCETGCGFDVSFC
jgi:hypothetical protein